MGNGRRARTADGADVEVFATGATIAWRRVPGSAEHSDLPCDEDHDDWFAHLGSLHGPAARPGPRPGHTMPAIGNRRGGVTDIVRPVLVNPVVASALAVSGALFDEPVPGLDVVHGRHDPDEARYLVWRATLTPARACAVPCTLHLLASPSMVVTVLELVPSVRIRWTQRAFLRDGVHALDVLATRLRRFRRPSELRRPSEATAMRTATGQRSEGGRSA